ncbi:hypothetical protein [Sphingomonas sp. R86521]|uniref:hypothetical protein n=1 Tax=Sphingomonas sp. R86521 TaxID=3093860 RepID=UPI0036D20B0A
MGPFSITKELVRSLGDERLRELLVRLLEAEARERGIPPSGIFAGGNQTAADGGIDASIDWQGGAAPSGWLPARSIVFQCKAEVMRAADLERELAPGGVPRAFFARLAEEHGAYVVFSTDDPTALRLQERLSAMGRAIATVSGGERVRLRFYGADAIARWTEQHIGVALWLLRACGRPLTGWQPLGDWSAPGSAGQPYIADSSDRVVVDGAPRSPIEALDAVRTRLRLTGGVVRLIGISGMGKTRFAEALFDTRVGTEPLSAATAIYADVGHDLAVSVPVLVEQLAGAGTRAVVIADNCPAGVHAQAASILARSPGRISLLTIDHELLDKAPEGTLVGRMGENTVAAITGLLAQRCPWLGAADREHLATFAGGNTRVALKIAEGSRDGVNAASLSDVDMLDRLFQTDRQNFAPESRRCADAASLVYAFFVEPADHDTVEHPILAGLAGVPSEQFYEEIGRFIDFGVAQRRGGQRAIMPPPIANMLARERIRRSEPRALAETFTAAPPRLLKSFVRRLGDLHAVPEAVSMVERLVGEGGPLGNPADLRGEARAAFLYAAPAAPDAFLAALVRALRGADRATLLDPRRESRRELARTLAKLAHSPARFASAMEVLLAFVRAEQGHADRHSVADYFHQRFWPIQSQTLADQVTRLNVIDRLLDDDADDVALIGVESLGRMLETSFSSLLDVGFGAQALTREWRPPSYEAWCRAAFDRLVDVAKSDRAAATRAKELIAHSFRQQLSAGGNTTPVVAMRAVRGLGYWDDGWKAVTEALHFRRASFKPELIPGLLELEREFRPRNVDELFEAFVLGEPWRHWHPTGRERRSARDVALLSRRLGECLGRRGDVRQHLDRAFTAQGQTSIREFAQGIGRVTVDPDALWAEARRSFTALDPARRNPTVFAGLLSGISRRNPGWVDATLEAATDDPELEASIVTLHLGVPMSAATIRRFISALHRGAVPANHFEALMYGGVSKVIPGADLAAFLRELYDAPGGAFPALQVLHMRLFGDRQDKRALAPELVELARELVTDPRTYQDQHSRHDHGLAETASIALSGNHAADVARDICRALRAKQRSKRGYREFTQLSALLLQRYPDVVLDEIVGEAVPDDIVQGFFGGTFRDNDNVDGRTGLDEYAALAWVARDPGPRALRLSELVPYAINHQSASGLAWSPLATALIGASPDPVAVLEQFERRFWTGNGSGSFASRFVRRRPLVAAFCHHTERRVRNWARDASVRLEADILRWEEHDQRDSARFE